MSKSANTVRVVVLDDYDGVSGDFTSWRSSHVDIDVIQLTEHIEDEEQLQEVLRDANVIVAMRERTALPSRLLGALEKLDLVVTTGMKNAAIEKSPGVLICGTRILGTPAAELTWALILAHYRRLLLCAVGCTKGLWNPLVGIGVSGQTIGIIGLGKIGQQIATVGAAFGMRVVAWSHNLTEDHAKELGVEYVPIEQLYRESDIVTVHVRPGERYRRFIDAEAFRLMKPDSLFVNTARSEVVDTEALMAALAESRIGGAALDVFDKEPLPSDSRLRSMPNVILTPHIGYVVTQNYQMFFEDAMECIEEFYAGSPVRVIQ